MPEEIIAGLDIGSTAVRLVVGQVSRTGNAEESKISVIGVAEEPSLGISKGIITSIEDAVNSIAKCLEKAERMTGIPLEHAWVGISGNHIICQESKGVVAVSKPNGEIREDDINRALEAAKAVASPPNYEILHVIPKTFTIDNQEGIKDPVGMTGVRLEVNALIIQGLSSQIKNLTKCVYRTGLDIDDLVLSILANSEAVLSSRQKELGVCLINIGGSTTSIVTFEEGDVIHTAVLPIGSDHITSDVAIGLRVSIDMAEKVKIEYGSAVPDEINKKEEIDLRDFGEEEKHLVSKRYIAEIIEARVEEIFEKCDKELKKIGRSGLLPGGIVLTGGGAKLYGLVEVAKKKFKLPAGLGVSHDLISTVDKVHDLSFSTALGLVLWGGQMYTQDKGSFGKMISKFKSVDKVTSQVKKWFKQLLP